MKKSQLKQIIKEEIQKILTESFVDKLFNDESVEDSLKTIKGQNIVQEDFELVCFDLVSSPSTPGAYVFPDLSDRDQYQESEEKKPLIDDRMKKLMGGLDKFLSK